MTEGNGPATSAGDPSELQQLRERVAELELDLWEQAEDFELERERYRAEIRRLEQALADREKELAARLPGLWRVLHMVAVLWRWMPGYPSRRRRTSQPVNREGRSA